MYSIYFAALNTKISAKKKIVKAVSKMKGFVNVAENWELSNYGILVTFDTEVNASAAILDLEMNFNTGKLDNPSKI